jgi:tRNA threonylcarbamoyladenosine biosynthesis protein TsaB
LAIDAGSPRVSVAVGDANSVLAEACEERQRSSATLLALIDGVLATAGLKPAELVGLVALRGPGSFTGLRVGLATALGLHQALELPAVGVPTLGVLAGLGPGDGSTVIAVVDALRGEWFAQSFCSQDPPRKLNEPRLLSTTELCDREPSLVIGFGAADLAALETAGMAVFEPPPLAGAAVRQVSRHPIRWDPASLVAPLYLRQPSAKPPSRPGDRRP